MHRGLFSKFTELFAWMKKGLKDCNGKKIAVGSFKV